MKYFLLVQVMASGLISCYNFVSVTIAILWLQRSVHKQQLTIPAERNHFRGHSGYHSYSGTKHLPNYNLHNSHIISATPSELPIPNETRPWTRPRSCMHCVHLSNNGTPQINSIHSTLAYAKCRCHRPDTTNKFQNRASLRENHIENENGKVFKRVEFSCVTKDIPQTVLPSLTKNPDHPSEQPLIESSFSDLTTSTSKLPTLKRYDLYSCIMWLQFLF